MESVAIGIIVPVYNAKRYLRQCIESVLNQTFQDFCLVLVDDGSTDGSGQICDAYAAKDRRIQVILQPNKGSVLARAGGGPFGICAGGEVYFPVRCG